MLVKERVIREVRNKIGWVYEDMKWLSEREAVAVNDRRMKQLETLRRVEGLNFSGNKIHYKNLSRGCHSCGQRKWACLFLTLECPGTCFFCPRWKVCGNEPVQIWGIALPRPKDCVDFLKPYPFQGVGISGGDPFVRFDNLLRYIRAIKRAYGRAMRVWVYTSGILVNKARLTQLVEAGMDELRIDISATRYNTGAVRIARECVDTVSVEIPAIPEDHDLLIRALRELEDIGADYLNIHELMMTRGNYKRLMTRGYTFRHHPFVPVVESDAAALKLLEYAAEKSIRLPVNYCSCCYKYRVHGAGRREHDASKVAESYEGITDAGYIRTIYLEHTPQGVEESIRSFKAKGYARSLWRWDRRTERLYIHHALLDSVSVKGRGPRVFLKYDQATMSDDQREGDDVRAVAINTQKEVHVRRCSEQTFSSMNLWEARHYKAVVVEGCDIPQYRRAHRIAWDLEEFESRFREFERIEVSVEEMF